MIFKKDLWGAYYKFDDLEEDLSEHGLVCQGGTLIPSDIQDMKVWRLEVGFKCTKCKQRWAIHVRNLKRSFMNSPEGTLRVWEESHEWK